MCQYAGFDIIVCPMLPFYTVVSSSVTASSRRNKGGATTLPPPFQSGITAQYFHPDRLFKGAYCVYQCSCVLLCFHCCLPAMYVGRVP